MTSRTLVAIIVVQHMQAILLVSSKGCSSKWMAMCRDLFFVVFSGSITICGNI